jgi:Domain of unknown function (DUF4375)
MSSNPQRDARQVTAWSVIEPFWDSVGIYDGPVIFQRDFETLPLPVRHLLAVHWCDSEVCNGGFHQIFSNSTGVLAPDALQGYRAIGLEECAQLVERSMSLFGEEYPRDRQERQSSMCKLERPGDRREEWDPFNDLDDSYYDARDRANFEEALDEFARRHS